MLKYSFFKKKILNLTCLSLMLIIFNSKGEDPFSIVFIHIGSQLPVYIKYALMQARLFNLDCPIYLIMNKNAKTTETDVYAFQSAHIDIFFCENLKPSPWHLQFLKETKLDKFFREGFWVKATERFFYLEELATTLKLSHIIQVESDNMLYIDLNEFINIFKNYKKIAAVFEHDNRCIPSFIYFNNPQSISELVQFIGENAKKGLDDMYIIGLYREKFGEDVVSTLPIIMPSYRKKYDFKDASDKPSLSPEMYYHNLEKFNSVFDAAAYGQYLGGQDPRNGKCEPPYVDPFCIFNSSYLKYEWIEDKLGRKIPYVIWNNEKYKINNLHIHSKKLEKFFSINIIG